MAISRRAILQLAIAPALLPQTRAAAQDLEPTVSKVYPGPSGRLVYIPDEQGNTIHDASHAGYRGGGVAIPTVPVQRDHLAGRRRQHRAHSGGHRQGVVPSARRRRTPRGGAAEGGLLPPQRTLVHSRERCRAPRRRHGRHRHRSSSGPARDAQSSGRSRRHRAVHRKGRWWSSGGASGRDATKRGDAGHHRRLCPGRLAHPARHVHARPSNPVTRSSCGASATRRGSTRSA